MLIFIVTVILASIVPLLLSYEVVNTGTAPPEHCGKSYGQRAPRIWGGDNATLGEYASFVSLSHDGSSHLCGGTLLGDRLVLTAAHCAMDLTTGHPRPWLKVGASIYPAHLWRETQSRVLQTALVCPNEDFRRFRNQADDFAILVLDRATSYTRSLQPACLPEVPLTVGGNPLKVAGLGRVDKQGHMAARLQVIKVDYAEGFQPPARFRVTRRDGKASFCPGDSGSPIYREEVSGRQAVVAVVSSVPVSKRCGSSWGELKAVDVYDRKDDILRLAAWCLRRSRLTS